MKTAKLKFGALALGAGVLALGSVTSCTKTDTVTKTVTDSVAYTPPVTPPTNPDNLTDASGVDSGSLVAYFGFNGNLTEKVESLSGTNKNVAFVPGVKGQCYQGNGDSYALYSNPGTALPALQSFSLAFWIKEGQPLAFPSGDTSSTPSPGLGAQGLFDLVNDSVFWANLHIDFEPKRLPDGVTPDPDSLDMKIELTSVATGVQWVNQFPEVLLPGAVNVWTHIVITYDGASGNFTIYQNGISVGRYGYAGSSTENPYVQSSITLYASSPGATTYPTESNPGAAPVLGKLQFQNAKSLVIGNWQLGTNPSLTTGAGAQVWASAYAGSLDELRIFSNAMTSNDAQSLYVLEKAGF